jgi:hypothetical protein
MTDPKDISNEDLAHLDQASLIAIILELRKLIASQATQIKERQDPLARTAANRPAVMA